MDLGNVDRHSRRGHLRVGTMEVPIRVQERNGALGIRLAAPTGFEPVPPP